jgi:hypothetical protein
VDAAMGEFGAAVVVTAAKPRAEAGLEAPAAGGSSAPAAGGSSACSSPTAAQGVLRWAELPGSADGSTANRHGRTSRPSIEVPGSTPTAPGAGLLQRFHAAGSTSIQSPGGVSLHARTPGAKPSLSIAARLAADGEEPAGSSGSSGRSTPTHHRPKSAGRNQMVPVDSGRLAAEAAAAAEAGIHGPSLQQQPDAEELQQDEGDEAGAGSRQEGLPTISGRALMTRLQPMYSPRAQ